MPKKLTYDYVKSYIESFDYKLLSEEYTNLQTKLEIECTKGHVYSSTFANFWQGRRCPICKGINQKKLNKKQRLFSYNYVKSYIESFDYKLLSEEYKNIKTKLKIQCNKGHSF